MKNIEQYHTVNETYERFSDKYTSKLVASDFLLGYKAVLIAGKRICMKEHQIIMRTNF
jgi:hypothetical protein